MGVKEVSAAYSALQGVGVPTGYKQTKVGVIPEDWNAKCLGEVATLQRGYDLPYRLRKAGSIPIVTSSGSEDWHSEAKVKGPGVVTGRYGTIGQVFLIEVDFWPLNTTLYVRDFHGNSPAFISYMLRTIDFHTHSGKSGVPGVNRNDLHEIVVPIPRSIGEQESIVEALSDADALIESLEQLLTKKRQLKQGVMQELLTGQKRLPGFTGEWSLCALGEMVDSIVGGGTPSRNTPQYWGGEIPWMTVKDFANFSPLKTSEYITFEGLKNSSSHLIKRGTLIISTRMALGKAVIFEVDVSINQDLKALYLRSDMDVNFLYFWFQFNERQLSELGSGSTVMGISLSDLKKIEIEKPSRDEQVAIVTILSDMDSELAILQEKLSKARAVKQGLMQELLTGKIRLLTLN